MLFDETDITSHKTFPVTHEQNKNEDGRGRERMSKNVLLFKRFSLHGGGLLMHGDKSRGSVRKLTSFENIDMIDVFAKC